MEELVPQRRNNLLTEYLEVSVPTHAALFSKDLIIIRLIFSQT